MPVAITSDMDGVQGGDIDNAMPVPVSSYKLPLPVICGCEL